jgi:uncharacterized delta-60 repeat protein
MKTATPDQTCNTMNTQYFSPHHKATDLPLFSVAPRLGGLDGIDRGRPMLLALLAIVLAALLIPNALAAPGDLDLSFNSGSGADGWVGFVAIQPDGKVLIGGSFTTFNGVNRNGIARLNADGSLDTSYVPVELPYGNASMALQADGKLLVGGYSGLCRLNTDGSLDSSFTSETTGGGPYGGTLALQPDGKVVVIADYGFSIARLNADGSLDSSFTSYSTGDEYPFSGLVLQPDGKLFFNDYYGLHRLNADGTRDWIWNVGGDPSGPHVGLVLPDNRLLVTSSSFNLYFPPNWEARTGVVRVNPDLTLDTSFDIGLAVEGGNLTVNGGFWCFAAQSDGKFLFGGSFDIHLVGSTEYGPYYGLNIARFNSDGSLDTSFVPGEQLGGAVGTIAMQGDGKVIIAGGFTSIGGVPRNRIARLFGGGTPVTTTPMIQNLTPAQSIAVAGDVAVTINGLGFEAGSQVQVDGVTVSSTFVSASQLNAIILGTLLPTPVDFATVQITVNNPSGTVSQPAAFTVIGASVSGSVGQVQSGVAAAGETVAVQTLPSAPESAGVTASLENSSGTTPASVTAATYTENPTPAPAFEAGGGFVDLKISGADLGDRLSTAFYYPQTVTGGAEAALILKFFNGSVWLDVLSSGGVAPAKNTTDNLDGTVSGGRYQVLFDNTSTPKIMELNGTVFAVAVPDLTPPTVSCPNVTAPCNGNLLVPVTYPAPTVHDNIDPAPRVTYSVPSDSGFKVGTTTVTCTVTDAAGNKSTTAFTVTRAPLDFSGFQSPIGGSDGTGGSFAAPVRTFKTGSTIPVKFSAQCSGVPVMTGVHRLQATKYTSATTAGTPIDATPQDAATIGDQFHLSGQTWQFNLDTRSTGLDKGIWQLVATLSDGSQHTVWVQMK